MPYIVIKIFFFTLKMLKLQSVAINVVDRCFNDLAEPMSNTTLNVYY